MPTWLIIILLAILAVGLFVLAMSLTLIFKGHHIDSEISTNENMRKLGIKCAVQETREQMTGLEDCASEPGCSGNCAARKEAPRPAGGLGSHARHASAACFAGVI